MNPPEFIQDLCQAFLDGLNAALSDNLYGVYLFGAVAFPETRHTSDVDFHVILRRLLTKKEHSALVQLRERLGREFPPLGGEMDGHKVLCYGFGVGVRRAQGSMLRVWSGCWTGTRPYATGLEWVLDGHKALCYGFGVGV